MVDLIFRTERTVAGVRETHAQRFMHVRHVVQKRSTGTLVTVSRTTSVHVEEGERAETVSGQTGHQRDDVQALLAILSSRGSGAKGSDMSHV